jgi:hypothetical protein
MWLYQAPWETLNGHKSRVIQYSKKAPSLDREVCDLTARRFVHSSFRHFASGPAFVVEVLAEVGSRHESTRAPNY